MEELLVISYWLFDELGPGGNQLLDFGFTGLTAGEFRFSGLIRQEGPVAPASIFHLEEEVGFQDGASNAAL